jgi:(1->4)-alpha-D-glucan 1-alpha-D-glucosylmutase
MLVGAWPLGLHRKDAQGLALFRDRLKGWQRKSLREAKLQSSWLKPDAALEAAADDFLADLLDPDRSAPFLQTLSSFVARIAPAGVLNSLVQTTLRNTLPGVPDIYQGSECWDFTLVDPDNRRPVDFSVRTRTLREIPDGDPFASAWGNDRIKQYLIARLLGLRKSVPALFTYGDYQPLMAEGTRHEHILAFSRRYQRTYLVVIVPIHVGALCGTDTLMLPANWWGDTSVSLPRDMDSFQDILRSDAPAIVGSKIDLADHLAITPLLVLQSSLV